MLDALIAQCVVEGFWIDDIYGMEVLQCAIPIAHIAMKTEQLLTILVSAIFQIVIFALCMMAIYQRCFLEYKQNFILHNI